MVEKSKNEKIESYLKTNWGFRYNEVADKLELKKKRTKQFKFINDYEENSIRRKLIKNDLNVTASDLHDLLCSDFIKKYDPLKDYFEKLPKWDGTTDHIDQLGDTVMATNSDYWKLCLKKWLVAAVGSIFEDEIVNHTVLIFSGAQGIGKTAWQRRLIPASLNEYAYSGSINPKSKDSLTHLSECLIIMLDELANMNAKSIEDLKEIITKVNIRIRKPYGRNNELLPHRASFLGSVNDGQFLNDTTGNRRFICFSVKEIDYKHKIDINLAWAQAYALYKEGFKFYFEKEEIDQINANNEQFLSASPEEELLVKYFEPALDAEAVYKTATDICSYISSNEKIMLNNVIMGKILSKRGYKKKMKNGVSHWALKALKDSVSRASVKVYTLESIN